MSDQELILSAINLRTIGDDDCMAYWALSEATRAERLPDDPPLPYAMFAARLRSLPSFVVATAFLARPAPGAALIAAADIGYETSGENLHLAQFNIEVLPAQRRRGIGRMLLARVAGLAHAQGKRMLITASYDRVPAGRAFVERMGARPGLEDRQSQLDLAGLDRALLARWQAEAATLSAGFELLAWDNCYPEEHIAAFADLCDVMNTAPWGDLEIEDQKMTPARLREHEAARAQRGGFAWTVVAREVASGRMAGYSEIFGDPARPTIVQQGATAVRPEFRGHRLGRWMKAAMLEKLIAERPEARFVRTGNATSNAPMLAINNDLGFTPYMFATIWQVETATALGYAS